MLTPPPAFNDLELSFLELSRTRNLSADDATALKNLWARYFMMKATDEADKVWKEKKYSDETIKQWIKAS